MATWHAQSDANSSGLQTVNRAFALVDVLASRPDGITAKAAAAALGVSLGSAYHLLRTLTAAGYASQDPVGRLYRLGPRLSQINETFVEAVRAPPRLLPFAHALQQVTGETVELFSWWGANVVAAAIVDGSRPDRMPGDYVGYLSAPHVNAAGKALLAWAPAALMDACFARLDQPRGARSSQLGPDVLRAELDRIRSSGYALDRGDRHPDFCCVAAPIEESAGSVEHAVVVVVSRQRFARDEAFLIHSVLAIARVARARSSATEHSSMPGDPDFQADVDAALLARDPGPSAPPL